jgi:hypothetical protein
MPLADAAITLCPLQKLRRAQRNRWSFLPCRGQAKRSKVCVAARSIHSPRKVRSSWCACDYEDARADVRSLSPSLCIAICAGCGRSNARPPRKRQAAQSEHAGTAETSPHNTASRRGLGAMGRGGAWTRRPRAAPAARARGATARPDMARQVKVAQRRKRFRGF